MDQLPAAYDIDWWNSKDYDTLREEFEWELPKQFNMGAACADRHTGSDRPALIYDYPEFNDVTYSHDDLSKTTNRVANYLKGIDIGEGDVIGVCLPQSPLNPVVHIAAWKIGALSMPLTRQFGRQALSYRLENSEARCAVVDESIRDRFETIQEDLDVLSTVLSVEAAPDSESKFECKLEEQSPVFSPVQTAPSDPAMVIFSSGTTGNPKGIVHGHRILLATLPGFFMSWNNLELSADNVFWTPAAWAWGGALLNYVFPPLFNGSRVIATYRDSGFEAKRGWEIIEHHAVSKAFLPSTALRMLMEVDNPSKNYDLDFLSVIGSGGEQLGAGPYNWVQREFDDVVINEMFGQTEAHAFLGSCEKLYETKPGSVGRPIVGHEVKIVDEEANPLPLGEEGQIAIDVSNNPVMMLYFLRSDHSIDDRLRGDWWLTGDLGYEDEDGYFTVIGRQDDVIISSGYRIGPEEVEDVLCEFEVVQNCGVVGIPDRKRGEIIKAFVVLSDDVNTDDELKSELKKHAKNMLAAYEYPREIEFVESLPTTPSGKIKRYELRE